MINPEPSDTPPGGESSDQSRGQIESTSQIAAVTAPVERGLPSMPLSGVIRELQEGGVRGQGGMMLLAALANRVENEAVDLREEKRRLESTVSEFRDAAVRAERRAAVLEERIANIRDSQPLSAILVALGGTAVGIAYPYLTGANATTARWTMAVAITLLFLGWFIPRRSGRDR